MGGVVNRLPDETPIQSKAQETPGAWDERLKVITGIHPSD
jgi:hypothetical protein